MCVCNKPADKIYIKYELHVMRCVSNLTTWVYTELINLDSYMCFQHLNLVWYKCIINMIKRLARMFMVYDGEIDEFYMLPLWRWKTFDSLETYWQFLEPFINNVLLFWVIFDSTPSPRSSAFKIITKHTVTEVRNIWKNCLDLNVEEVEGTL